MGTPVVVYEDPGWQRLLPLVYIRAVFQLVCRMGDLVSRVKVLVGKASLKLWCRPGLSQVVAEQTGLEANGVLSEGGTLLLNGRGLWRALPKGNGEAWVGTVGPEGPTACVFADLALANTLSPSVLLDEAQTRAALSGLPRRDVGEMVRLMDWPWDLVLAQEEAFVTDWKERGCPADHAGRVCEGSYVLEEGAVHIGEGSVIKPCVVIDAEDGPVWIGQNVTVMPHSTVQGPAYIGDGSLIQPGSVIGGAYIGPVCKVGGEIEGSIVHGYSNKQHDGFLGHSYVGQWVNIAADCINSDLKNTYGTVRVPINGREVETGEMFVGMFVGDHSKGGINVSFPTGAVIGFCSSVFTPRCPKFVPSFAWVDGDRVDRYDEVRGLAIARKVMARRKVEMSKAEEEAFMAVTRQALAIERQPQIDEVWPEY